LGGANTIPDPLHNVYSVTADFVCSTAPTNLSFTALEAFFPAGTGAGIIGTGAGIIGPGAFTSDTTVVITDAPAVPVAYMIVSSKQ
jgi:hypothetical protein